MGKRGSETDSSASSASKKAKKLKRSEMSVGEALKKKQKEEARAAKAREEALSRERALEAKRQAEAQDRIVNDEAARKEADAAINLNGSSGDPDNTSGHSGVSWRARSGRRSWHMPSDQETGSECGEHGHCRWEAGRQAEEF